MVNATKGLFQYTRLPFGISSAPAIFQREMEHLFNGMAGVVVYLDDILVTGEDEETHLKTLEKVLGACQRPTYELERTNVCFWHSLWCFWTTRLMLTAYTFCKTRLKR